MAANLVIIGCGTMGSAILGGLMAGGQPVSVRVTAHRQDEADELRRRFDVPSGTDNAEAAGHGDVVLLCVKPQSAREVLTAPELQRQLAGKLLVSICAGVTITQLRSWTPEARIIRAMPNTPCLIGEGMTAISPGPAATEKDLETAREIFGAVGRCLVLDEKHMNAVTGLSGSGPAFACVILEALADGGVMMGLPRAAAVELAAQTVQGAARLVLQTGEHPAALRDSVTTPAGCTIAGLFKMEEGRVRSTLARTVQEATRVAAELGES